MAGYQIIGTTDENTECDICGRVELRSTVVFDALDADGNRTGELLYAGSSCATTLPGFRTISAATIRRDARRLQSAADRKAAADRVMARRINAKYRAVANGGVAREIARVFFGFNAGSRCTGITATQAVADLLATADAALAGYETEAVDAKEMEILFDLADLASDMRRASTLIEAIEIAAAR